jgi:hypothetical protein
MEKPNLWEDIKVGAREGLEVLKEELSKVTQELEKHGKIIKKKMDLSSIQRKVHQSFARLGSRLYELVEEGNEKTVLKDPEILKTIADIKVYKAEVEAIEDEIIRIKEEGTQKKPEADKGRAETPTDKEETKP